MHISAAALSRFPRYVIPSDVFFSKRGNARGINHESRKAEIPAEF
jgi:hypothetical protein